MKRRLIRDGLWPTIKQILWPPFVRHVPVESNKRLTWPVACTLSVIPLTAFLHHAVFYPHTCILDPFGPDYVPSVMYKWLSRDPSLPWSIIIMASAYAVGNRHDRFRLFILPVFISFLPLSLWVWDIPFTNRTICSHFHSGRLVIFDEILITRRYFYLFGFVVWLSFVISLTQKHNVKK